MAEVKELIGRHSVPEIESCTIEQIADAQLDARLVSMFSGISKDGSIGIQVYGFNEVAGAEKYALAIADLPALCDSYLALAESEARIREAGVALLAVMEFGDEDASFTDDEGVSCSRDADGNIVDDPLTFGHIRRFRQALGGNHDT